MTNKEIRQWYLNQISTIPDLNEKWLKEGISVKIRAERSWRIRHDARIQAREMMERPEEVELLRQRDIKFYGHPDGPSFEHLVNQGLARGLPSEDIYEAIIDSSSLTNEEINRKLSLE